VVPEPVTPPPIPAPSLGAILSAEERKKLDAEYQADLHQANEVLNSVRGRPLTPSQKDSVNRAQAFVSQAAQYHDRDLAMAAELARRARVLTQDLAGAH
jgi:membrane-bound ClpP family serine protease